MPAFLCIYIYISVFYFFLYLICSFGTSWLSPAPQQNSMDDPSLRNPFLQVARRRFFSNEFKLARTHRGSLICHFTIYSMAHPNEVIFTGETEPFPLLWHRNWKGLVSSYWSQGPSSIISVQRYIKMQRLSEFLTPFALQPRWMLCSVWWRTHTFKPEKTFSVSCVCR